MRLSSTKIDGSLQVTQLTKKSSISHAPESGASVDFDMGKYNTIYLDLGAFADDSIDIVCSGFVLGVNYTFVIKQHATIKKIITLSGVNYNEKVFELIENSILYTDAFVIGVNTLLFDERHHNVSVYNIENDSSGAVQNFTLPNLTAQQTVVRVDVNTNATVEPTNMILTLPSVNNCVRGGNLHIIYRVNDATYNTVLTIVPNTSDNINGFVAEESISIESSNDVTFIVDGEFF